MNTMPYRLSCLLFCAALVLPAAAFAAGAPASIFIITGNNQSAIVDTNVKGIVCAQVKDANGMVVAVGTDVLFSVSSGGGSVTGATQQTDNQGIVTLGSWKLGTMTGPNTLSVTCGNATPLTFTAAATPDVPASISITSGNNQSAPTGATVALAVSVTVFDKFSNKLAAGTTVMFAVTAGGGSVTGGNATTDSNGVATLGSWQLGSNAGTNTLTVTSGSAPSVMFTATGTSGGPPMIVSGPDATPNPVTVGHSVLLSVAASGTNLTYSWTFGDGFMGFGASVQHTYLTPGTYSAIVSINDNVHLALSSSTSVTVNAAESVVGSGPDSDGDGFSDSFEIVAGSASNNATSSPIGQAVTAQDVQTLTLSSAAIKLNFAKGGGDSITFAGTLAVPDGFTVSGARLLVDVGGISKRFFLTSRGSAIDGFDVAKLTVKSSKGIVVQQTSKFSVSFKKGNYAAPLSVLGMTNSNTVGATVPVTFTVIFDNTVLQATRMLTYSAMLGKTGSAK